MGSIHLNHPKMPNSCSECSLGGVIDLHELVGDWKPEWVGLGSRIPVGMNIQNGCIGTMTGGAEFCNLKDEETKFCQRPLMVVKGLILQMRVKIEGSSPLDDKTLNNYFDATNRQLVKIFGPQFKPVPHDKKSIDRFYKALLAQAQHFRAECKKIVDPIEVVATLLEEPED
jgi:hypothetical protein